jgi:hypothetical protein
MSIKRILLAFVLAPLATPLVFVVAWIVFGTLPFDELQPLIILISMFAYPAALLFGVPVVLVTRRLRYSSKVVFIATGAAVGLLLAAITDLGFRWFEGFPFYLLCFIAGSLSGLAFAIIVFGKSLMPKVNESS